MLTFRTDFTQGEGGWLAELMLWLAVPDAQLEPAGAKDLGLAGDPDLHVSGWAGEHVVMIHCIISASWARCSSSSGRHCRRQVRSGRASACPGWRRARVAR